MTLTFTVRASYGHTRYYPVNGPAKALMRVVERLCLEDHQLEDLRKGGFRIELVSQPTPIRGPK